MRHNQRFRCKDRDEKLLFQFVSSITLSIKLYLFDHSLLVLRYVKMFWYLLLISTGERKRMSDALIKGSLTVIMTHLSTAPDPNSCYTSCRTSIRACICLWISITGLIPGGIRHIFQCGAIKTPGEAWSRWTTCRKLRRDGQPFQGRRIPWTCMTSIVLPVIKGADVIKCDRKRLKSSKITSSIFYKL